MILFPIILAASTVPVDYHLTAAGWFIMISSVTFVTILMAWCSYRVLRESTKEKIRTPLDIDTHDTNGK